jgi:hypothetical protein
MSKPKKIESKIIILDDDIWPDGRITNQILPEFKRRGLDQYVHHYSTFADLKKDLQNGTVSTNNLFVLDSSLDKEPNRKPLSFCNTIPWLNSHGISITKMKPQHQI